MSASKCESFREESSERILVVQTVPQALCCVCCNLQTMREPMLISDTQKPLWVYTAWWKCWKPAPLNGQRGHIQWPKLVQVGPQALCPYRKILFSKTTESLETPLHYIMNTPPAVPLRTHTMGKITFIHFHKKEPWISASFLLQDPPPALPAALSIGPRPCFIDKSQVKKQDEREQMESCWEVVMTGWEVCVWTCPHDKKVHTPVGLWAGKGTA